jgi:hypothetical protein
MMLKTSQVSPFVCAVSKLVCQMEGGEVVNDVVDVCAEYCDRVYGSRLQSLKEARVSKGTNLLCNSWTSLSDRSRARKIQQRK